MTGERVGPAGPIGGGKDWGGNSLTNQYYLGVRGGGLRLPFPPPPLHSVYMHGGKYISCIATNERNKERKRNKGIACLEIKSGKMQFSYFIRYYIV